MLDVGDEKLKPKVLRIESPLSKVILKTYHSKTKASMHTQSDLRLETLKILIKAKRNAQGTKPKRITVILEFSKPKSFPIKQLFGFILNYNAHIRN